MPPSFRALRQASNKHVNRLAPSKLPGTAFRQWWVLPRAHSSLGALFLTALFHVVAHALLTCGSTSLGAPGNFFFATLSSLGLLTLANFLTSIFFPPFDNEQRPCQAHTHTITHTLNTAIHTNCQSHLEVSPRP